MGETITALAGTPEGARLALILALISAFMHASLGALQKGRHDPWISRAAMDVCSAILALPAALFLVPPPSPTIWLFLLGATLIHLWYKLALAVAYERAPYVLVYPVTRGAGVLATVTLASVVFNESYGLVQWAGVALLSGAILALAMANLRGAPMDAGRLTTAVAFAIITGAAVAAYTVYDAYAIRQTPNPFTFIVWFFVVEGVLFPLIVLRRWRRMPDRPAIGPLLQRGVVGAVVAFISFGGVMLATRLDKVGEAAAIRETSIAFSALLGWLALGERLTPTRIGLIGLIAAGALLVEFG
jgi:drug/metabolite transporter (DMT)-like permease